MKVGVLGVGRMGRRHILVAQQLGLELVGIHDASAATLGQAVQECELAGELAFSSARELLEQRRPDCVIIASTADAHCPLTCLAAECGAKYILCEKPMAVSLLECDRMIAACDSTGAVLAVNHPRRFMRLVREARRIVTSEEFGELRSLTVIGGNWGLAMNGSHFIELFLYLTGERVSEVTAWLTSQDSPNPRGERFVDRAGSIRLVTPNGRRFYLDIGADQSLGQSLVYGGRHGQLAVDELRSALSLTVREAEHRVFPSIRDSSACYSEFAAAESDGLAPLRAVWNALLSGGDVPQGQYAKHVIEVLVAAYVSHERGNTRVSLADGDLPSSRAFPWA